MFRKYTPSSDESSFTFDQLPKYLYVPTCGMKHPPHTERCPCGGRGVTQDIFLLQVHGRKVIHVAHVQLGDNHRALTQKPDITTHHTITREWTQHDNKRFESTYRRGSLAAPSSECFVPSFQTQGIVHRNVYVAPTARVTDRQPGTHVNDTYVHPEATRAKK